VKRRRLSHGDGQRWGKALTRTSAWREAGRLACSQVETSVSAEGNPAGNAAQSENSAKSCYLCVCLYTLVRHCAIEYATRPAIVRLAQSGRRVYIARVLSVDQKVLLGSDTNIDLSRARSTDALVSRIATRAASSTSTLQHSHTIAVRRCAAVLRETPSPPPIARYAARHIGHFGTRASAILGSAKAAALRVRGLDLFSVTGRPGSGPGAASLEG
jgi:hypothetical protein